SERRVRGGLSPPTRVRESKPSPAVNRNDQERLLLIEHPVRNEFKLTDTDKPAETASDFYRFELKLPAGKTEKLVVTEERIINQSVALSNLDDNNIRVFLQSPATSAKVKAALEQALKLRWEVAKTQRDIQEEARQLKTITDDQVRLRANLREMPPTAAAYKRYLDKFDAQEVEIEKMQAKIKQMQGTEANQKKELEDFLASLNVD